MKAVLPAAVEAIDLKFPVATSLILRKGLALFVFALVMNCGTSEALLTVRVPLEFTLKNA
jgi:hypothetical protein